MVTTPIETILNLNIYSEIAWNYVLKIVLRICCFYGITWIISQSSGGTLVHKELKEYLACGGKVLPGANLSDILSWICSNFT